MINNQICLLLLILFFNLSVKSQTDRAINFIGFNHPICTSPMLLSYTFTNSPLKILKNGVEVYDFGYDRYGYDLKFIDDSTGFLVYSQTIVGGLNFPYTVVLKTFDYGNSWTIIGISIPGYYDLYVINKNFAYLVSNPSHLVNVVRCSDIAPSSNLVYPPTCGQIVCDPDINADLYVTDTITGFSTCLIDSVSFSVLNSANDTITYHFNWMFIPVGVPEKEIGKEKLIIYPNPAESYINIENNNFIEGEILSIDGKKIKTFDTQKVDIEELDTGIYFIKIKRNKEDSCVLKFIKK